MHPSATMPDTLRSLTPLTTGLIEPLLVVTDFTPLKFYIGESMVAKLRAGGGAYRFSFISLIPIEICYACHPTLIFEKIEMSGSVFILV